MTPFDKALAVYIRHPTKRDFGEDIAAHLRSGYVISAPWGFVAFRPVLRDSPEELIVDPITVFPYADTWHVWLAAGDWRRLLLRHLPFPLPWISWEREFRLRFWSLEKLLAKAGRVSLAGIHGKGWIESSNR